MSGEFIAQWLFDTLFATGILLALVLIIRRPVAQYFGPQIAYLLWLIPLARLFMPAITRTIEVPDPTIYPGGMAGPMDRLEANVATVAVAPEPLVTLDLLLSVWLIGAALVLIVQLAAYLQHRSELLADAVELDQIGSVKVIEVAGISGPFAFGLLAKYIALPIGFDRMFTPRERDLALAHELAHHRAGDLWANFAGLVMLSIHWFNPVAWLAWRSFRFDQEAACDARVLAHAPDRSLYGRVIAKAATGRTLVFASPLTPQSKIKQRLQLMNKNAIGPVKKKVGIAAIIGGMASAMAITATVSYAYAPTEWTESRVVPEMPDMPVAPEEPESPKAPMPGEMVQEINIVTELGEGAEAPMPPLPPLPPAAPNAPAAPEAPKMIKQQERHIITHNRDSDGQTLVMRDDQGERKLRVNNCEGRPRSADFITETVMENGRKIKAQVLTCGDIHIDRAAILKEAAEGIKAARAEIAAMEHFSQAERAKILAEMDRELAQMRIEMGELRGK